MRRKFTRVIFCASLVSFIIIGWVLLFQHLGQLRPIQCGSSNLIRLHVLANSDSSDDQQLKLQVRDAVIKYLEPYLQDVTDVNLARKIVKDHQTDIYNAARQVLVSKGVDYPLNVQLGMFEFPVKYYGNLVLPAGRYEAVRILIGRAEGKNWWCVLFPPLCFIDITHAAALPVNMAGQTDQPEENLEFRWKVTETLMQSNL